MELREGIVRFQRGDRAREIRDMRRSIFMKIFVLLLLAVLTPLVGFSAALRVAGSDLLGPEFEAALKAFSTRTSLSVTTSFTGSRVGLEDLKAGRADVALVA